MNRNGKEYKNECICVYNWVTLLYSRDWHNIVNQLYFNKKSKNRQSLKEQNPRSLLLHSPSLGTYLFMLLPLVTGCTEHPLLVLIMSVHFKKNIHNVYHFNHFKMYNSVTLNNSQYSVPIATIYTPDLLIISSINSIPYPLPQNNLLSPAPPWPYVPGILSRSVFWMNQDPSNLRDSVSGCFLQFQIIKCHPFFNSMVYLFKKFSMISLTR